MAELGVSQPTLSRALRTLGDDLLPLGAARSIQYALRDATREHLQAPVYRVSAAGQLRELGTLVPVHPDGFVMVQSDGVRLHTEGLPWWLFDMRPQGYLGRAYNQRHGGRLGLPTRLTDWNDGHVLRALLQQGDDLPGNLLLGDAARDVFLNAPAPQPIALEHKAQAYAELAAAADRACSAFVRSSATLRITLGREPGIVSLRGDVEEVVPTWLRGRGGDAAMAEAPSS